MPTHDKTTTDDTQSSQAVAQQKPGSGITDKIGGVVNIIHGTGEVIRGHALEAGDFGHGHGDGREIIAAGRDEVERGLNRVEGTATSATGASRADPTSEKDRGDAVDTSYLAERGTAGAAANGTHSPSPEQYHGDQNAATAHPRDPLGAGDNSPGVQPSTDVRQQGDGIAPGDPSKESRATADALMPHTPLTR